MPISSEPLWLPKDFFDVIRDEGEFREFALRGYAYDAKIGLLKPKFLAGMMHDVYQCYKKDTERLDHNMPTSPDHFKCAGFIAYWLRRHPPVYKFQEMTGELSDKQEKVRELILKYGNVLLAFSYGYQICLFFEQGSSKSANPKMPQLDLNYIESICYLMKYKNVSPHSLGFIYRSLFYGFGDSE